LQEAEERRFLVLPYPMGLQHNLLDKT
jgi:hypothetical protein